MFYVIRFVFIAILVLLIIFLFTKGKKLQKQRAEQGDNTEIVVKKRHYVYSMIICLLFLGIIIGSFCPIEKTSLPFQPKMPLSATYARIALTMKDSSMAMQFFMLTEMK